MQPVVNLVKKLSMEGKFPLSLALEMRIMADSDVLLSPALVGNPKHGGSGHTVYIEASNQ